MRTAKTPSSDHTVCDHTAAAPLITLEGMPGTGKTTVAAVLAAEGRQVIGEYTTPSGAVIPVADHPGVDDDQAHAANWLTKHRLAEATRQAGPVLADRDWLSALAYAASLADGDTLLRDRVRWAREHLAAGRLTRADTYLVLDIDPATSLRRRATRLTPGHPWSTRAGLIRLRVFYADPPSAVAAVDERLGQALRSADWHHPPIGDLEQVLRYARDLMDRP